MAYVRQEELDALMSANFDETELEQIGWTKMTDKRKGLLNDRATDMLNSLFYKGYKCNFQQNSAFPRYIDGKQVDFNDRIAKYYANLVFSLVEEEKSKRKKAQKEGVKSVSINGLSESYGDKVAPNFREREARKTYLRSYLMFV